MQLAFINMISRERETETVKIPLKVLFFFFKIKHVEQVFVH